MTDKIILENVAKPYVIKKAKIKPKKIRVYIDYLQHKLEDIFGVVPLSPSTKVKEVKK